MRGEARGFFSLRLLDMTGRIVLEETQTASSREYNLAHLAGGVYLYQISGFQGVMQKGRHIVQNSR